MNSYSKYMYIENKRWNRWSNIRNF